MDGAGVMVEHMQSAECFRGDCQAVSDPAGHPAGRCSFSSSYVAFPFILSILK